MVPIKPENRDLYPDNWPEIVAAVHARSGNRCEFIVDGKRCEALQRRRHPITGAIVVLTVAHLDHDPRNCDMGNLRDACQKCHNTYDAAHRAETRKRTKNQMLDEKQAQLFGGDS